MAAGKEVDLEEPGVRIKGVMGTGLCASSKATRSSPGHHFEISCHERCQSPYRDFENLDCTDRSLREHSGSALVPQQRRDEVL